MKRIVPILSIVTIMAVLITACGRKSETQSAQALSNTDTVGLAQFQNWKYQNERLDPNQYYQQTAQKTTAKKTSTNYGSGSMNSGSANQAKTTQKKGWSKAAKGAAIGGGAGAIAGAVLIKKNRVAGGALGAIAGGAIGYVIGRAKDKKDGRY